MLIPTILLAVSLIAVDCDDQQTTHDIVYCIGVEVDKAQSELDRVMRDVRDSRLFTHSERTIFEDAHEKWKEFVEADCDAVFQHYIEGTIRGPMYQACRWEHIDSRRKVLEDRYLWG